MRRNVHILLVGFIGLTFLFFGCSKTKQESPSEASEVVKAAYMAANEGKYSEADKYSAFGDMIKEMTKVFGGSTKETWDETTRNGTIERIEILKEKIEKESMGTAVRVYFRLYFKDGQTKDDDNLLIKDEDGWKIVLGEIRNAE